jgi:hypothetical protein
MPLPYPHGSSAGQIAHNSIYDTGVTPGSTGGKFIGWGEEGTSNNANRAHWALSENIDYVYQKMAADKAIPKGQAIAAGHGGINKYQLSGDIFCGDLSYPALEPEGLLLLFSVMDENYDELTDGAGHEVLVYLVRDSTETTNEYQSGFVTNPWVYFEADGSPYVIPDAQEIRLLYAEKGNMENLPVDAFTRFKLNSAAEAQAGVVLQDDQNTIGNGVQLSQSGETGIYDTAYGEHGSLVKSVNAKTRGMEGLLYSGLAYGYDNTVTIPGSGGIINWGATGIMKAGQFFVASAGSLNMASPMQPSGWYYVATDGGSVYLRDSGSLQTGDVALWYINWDGANVTESRKLARVYDGRIDAMEITVGGRGSDFASSQMQEALNYAAHVGTISGSADVAATTVIRVKTGANWSQSLQIRSDVIIRGEGMGRTILRSNCGTNADAIKGNGFRVIIEDLTIQHDSDEMVSWVAMIRNFGPWSEFRRLELKAGTSFNKNFSIAFLIDASQYSYYCTFDSIKCYDPLTAGFIRGCEFGLSGNRLEAYTVRNCQCAFSAASDYAILCIRDVTVLDCQFWADAAGGLGEYGIVCGANSRLENVYIWGWSPSGAGIGVYLYWNEGDELTAQVNNCIIYSCNIGIRVYLNQVARYTAINIRGGKIDDCDTGISVDPNACSTDSYVNIEGVAIENINVRGVFVNNANVRTRISRCLFTNIYGMGVQVTAGPTQVERNYFAGWGTGGALNNCVDFAGFSGMHAVVGNKFGTGAPAGGKYISTAAPVTVFGNNITGPGGSNTCIGVNLVGGSDNSFVGYNIIASVLQGVRVEGTVIVFIFGAGNRIEGNRFWDIPLNGWGVLIDGAEYQTILGNEFSGSVGGAIKIQHLSTGAAGDAKSNMIANNTIYSVQGKVSGAYRIIQVEETSGSSRMTSILGNKLYLCGHTDVGSSYQYQIQGNAADCHIAGNMISWLQGANTDTCAAINWSGPASIVGNYVMHDMSNVFVGRPGAMYGLVGHSQDMLFSGNFIDFKNTSPDIYPTSVYAIYVSTSHVAIVGNAIREWQQTGGTPNNEAIFASNLKDGVVCCNWSEDHRIYFDGERTPAIGNYGGSVPIVRTTLVNKHPEDTLYNATAQVIFTDMNY